MRIIGHRGESSLAPQNTIAAFTLARLGGVDMIELDIQPLADGHAAVIHDDTVDATTNAEGLISSFTSHTIKDLDAGAWFSPYYRGERIPLLPEVISFFTQAPHPELLLEIKGVWEEQNLVEVFSLLDQADLGHRVVVQSFEAATLATTKKLAPHLRREWLLGEWRDDAIEVAYELDVQGVNPHGAILLEHPDFVDEMHGAGLSVAVWVLNEPTQWNAARNLGVDGIITDKPTMLRGWLAGITNTNESHP